MLQGTRSWWVFWTQNSQQLLNTRISSHYLVGSTVNVNSKHEWHTKSDHHPQLRKLGTCASRRSSWNLAFASRSPSKVACIQACRVWMSRVRRRRTANKQSSCMALRFHAICSHHHLSIDFVSCTHKNIHVHYSLKVVQQAGFRWSCQCSTCSAKGAWARMIKRFGHNLVCKFTLDSFRFL